MNKILPRLLFLVVVTSGCALVDVPSPWAASYSAVGVFPSPYSSDWDFLNIANDDSKVRAQARRRVYEFYQCLSNVNANSGRPDPMVSFRSQLISFSEIPGRIYQSRLDRLAGLTKDYNQAPVRILVDREINDLKQTPWNEIQEEVNAMTTGGRKLELDKVSCPVKGPEIPQRGQLVEAQQRDQPIRTTVKKETLSRWYFLPPNM